MKGISILVAAICLPVSAVSQLCVDQLKVPKYPALAWAAQLQGTVDLNVTIGEQGHVAHVEGSGPVPILVEQAKSNVKEWEFCSPRYKEGTHARLRFAYRLEGARVYRPPTAKVVINLEEAIVAITSPPAEPEP